MKTTHKILLSLGAALALLLVGMAILLWPVISFVRQSAEQIRIGTAFMQSMTEQDLSEWMAWADEQMNVRRTSEVSKIRLYVPEDELPSKIQGLGLIRYTAETNFVALDWLGGMGCTSLRFRRDWEPYMQVEACYTEDKSELLWPKEKRANKRMKVTSQ